MIASIGPFWDANETWIVLGIGILLMAFPHAHGIVLSELYLPVTLMLIGLILRGVAFDFRAKVVLSRKALWNRLFFLGSLVTAISQGWMVGRYVTGLQQSLVISLFSCLIALTMPALYILLGVAWLLIKSSGRLYDKAMRWGRRAVLPMGLSLLSISLATPLVSESIAAKWFTLPDSLVLLPIPLTCVLAYGIMLWLLFRPQSDHDGRIQLGVLLFMILALLCLMATVGLAYSLFPDIILGQMTIYEAAAAEASLRFVFIGTVITVPMILVYTTVVYRLFGGELSSLDYE